MAIGAEDLDYNTHPYLRVLTRGLSEESRWTEPVITYAFEAAGVPVEGYRFSQTVAPNSYAKDYWEEKLAQISSFTNLRFERVDSTAQAMLDIQMADYLSRGDHGYTVNSAMNESTAVVPDYYFTNSVATTQIGEALGLGYPYSVRVFGGDVSYHKDFHRANVGERAFTIMAASSGSGSWDRPRVISGTENFGPLDIATLQAIYGANASYNAGDTKHYARDGLHTIWDAGGEDWIDYSTAQRRAVIDLRPASLTLDDGGGGYFSYVASQSSLTDTYSAYLIAYGVVIENGVTGAGNDELIGNDAANILRGGQGNDSLNGLDGDDALYGEDGDDILFGLAGDDLLAGGGGNDFLRGVDGDDTLYGGWGDDTLRGERGDDRLWGHGGADTLLGEGGDDQLRGGGGNDRLDGGSGNDALYGGSGLDRLEGGAGNDALYGQRGDDNLSGGGGNDILSGDQGADLLRGDEGADTLNGGGANDRLFGGAGADTLFGGQGADYMSGGGGNDALHGGGGGDQLLGGDGRDFLSGEGGDDSLTGGAKADIFYFQGGHGVDIITDFTAGLDRISLRDHQSYAGFSDVTADASQNGADVHIKTGGANVIIIENTRLGALDAADFIF